jgi:Uma2 family endonuclease
MSTVVKQEIETMEDLLARLGDIPPGRVLMRPLPGEATEADLLDHIERTGKCSELIDDILVEKAMGQGESGIASWITMLLGEYILPRSLGCLFSADSIVRLRPGVVRSPDISFIRKDRLPGGLLDMTPIGEVIPDLAVEVLSASNTKAEIERKIGEYFLAGVEAVWIVDHFRRVVVVHTSVEEFVTLAETDTLDGGTVFPGLDLPLARIFEIVPPTKKRQRRKRNDS